MSEVLVREIVTHPAAPIETAAGATPDRRRRRLHLPHLGVVAASLVLLIAAGWAFVPRVFASGDPLTGIPAQRLSPPSLSHWFGTDNIGRDLYTRVVHGAALSLSATLLAIAIALVVGSLLGLLAGATGGVVDAVISRVIDVLLSIPTLLLALALVTALGFGTVNVAIAVGITFIASFARVMRSQVLGIRQRDYVEAAFASGARWPRVLFTHILPNSYGPVLALAAVQFGMAVLAISSLSFLGFGAVPPTPEWGALVSEGRNYMATAWWLTTIPGIVLVVVVLSAHHLGHTIKDRAQ